MPRGGDRSLRESLIYHSLNSGHKKLWPGSHLQTLWLSLNTVYPPDSPLVVLVKRRLSSLYREIAKPRIRRMPGNYKTYLHWAAHTGPAWICRRPRPPGKMVCGRQGCLCFALYLRESAARGERAVSKS